MSDCYTSGFICQIVDNHLFSTKNNVYEEILNAAEGCCVNVTNLVPTSKFGRTFAENDPYRMIEDGRPPSDAAFERKIDGHQFIPGHCDDAFSNTLNLEQVNLYNYQLEAMKTEYVTLTTDVVEQTIDDKRERTLGDVVIRNTQSSIITNIRDLAPTLNSLPEVYTNVVDFDIIYDHLLLYTPDSLYVEKLSYNYTTGKFDPSSTMPIVVKTADTKRSALIKPYFNEDKKHLVFGRTIVDRGVVLPELYRYNIATGAYSKIHGDGITSDDLDNFRLPPDLTGKFVIKSVNSTHLTYNSILQKYTITTTGRLSATSAELIRVSNTGDNDVQYADDILYISIHNFSDSGTTLEYIDSIIYHPHNKREYILDLEDTSRNISLSADAVINMGTISDPRTVLSLDPRSIPVREYKLKEIRYTYAGKTVTNSRLPINDMGYANITDISEMVESYVPHTSGGPTDFASPRYRPLELDLDLNLDEISVVRIDVECVYYDNHRATYTILGESRPVPIMLLFDDINIVDTVSFTGDSNPSLLKLVLETRNPRYITEVIIDNNSTGVDIDRNSFDSPPSSDHEFSEPVNLSPTPTPTPTPTSP
jgi:hypothetical protein